MSSHVNQQTTAQKICYTEELISIKQQGPQRFTNAAGKFYTPSMHTLVSQKLQMMFGLAFL